VWAANFKKKHMDTIQYITPDFTITVTPKTVTAVINAEEDGMEWRPVDITNTSLGKLLWAQCREKFAAAQERRHEAE